MRRKKMGVKTLVVLGGLFVISVSSTFAQDLYQDEQTLYRERVVFPNYDLNAFYLLGNSNSMLPVPATVNEFDDVRSMDLSSFDFSNRIGLIETLTFNEETLWPVPAQLPPGDGPVKLMSDMKNPGLGVGQLHNQGITGAGINVAIIDQPIYQDHPEYNGKIKEFYDTGCGGISSSMHGPAVTSLLVGENCGTAPGAHVYYAATPSWELDAAYYADALNWIVAKNGSLPDADKIRVVSVSAIPSGPGSPFLHNHQMWDDAVAIAEAAGILVLDGTAGHGFVERCWYDRNDPENVAGCTPGTPQFLWFDPEDILTPSSVRTTAQHDDHHGRNSYAYWGYGGLSWSIPYCAGVLAMGWQVSPELTADEIVAILFQSAYVTNDGAKIIDPQAFVNFITNPTTSSTSTSVVTSTTTPSSSTTTTPTSDSSTTTTSVQITFTISGEVTGDISSNVPIVLTGTESRIINTDFHGSYEFSNLASGYYVITPHLAGYIFEPPHYEIQNLTSDVSDFDFVSDKERRCCVAKIYGEGSEEVEIMRYIRDNVLRQTPEGQELITLYYQWSPVIVRAIEGDEEFKEEIKEMIDMVIPLLEETKE